MWFIWSQQWQERKRGRETQSRWLAQDQSGSLDGITEEADRQVVFRRLWSCMEEEEEEGIGLLSSDFSRLELGHKVFDSLVLEVGAHIAGEGSVCMTFFSTAGKKKEKEKNLKLIKFYITKGFDFLNVLPPTRFFCHSLAIEQSPGPSCPPGICCSRLKTFPQSVSSCSTAPWARCLMCLPQSCSRRKASCHLLVISQTQLEFRDRNSLSMFFYWLQ